MASLLDLAKAKYGPKSGKGRHLCADCARWGAYSKRKGDERECSARDGFFGAHAGCDWHKPAHRAA